MDFDSSLLQTISPSLGPPPLSLQVVKCLEAVCQSPQPILPLVEVRTQCWLAHVLTPAPPLQPGHSPTLLAVGEVLGSRVSEYPAVPSSRGGSHPLLAGSCATETLPQCAAREGASRESASASEGHSWEYPPQVHGPLSARHVLPPDWPRPLSQARSGGGLGGGSGGGSAAELARWMGVFSVGMAGRLLGEGDVEGAAGALAKGMAAVQTTGDRGMMLLLSASLLHIRISTVHHTPQQISTLLSECTSLWQQIPPRQQPDYRGLFVYVQLLAATWHLRMADYNQAKADVAAAEEALAGMSPPAANREAPAGSSPVAASAPRQLQQGGNVHAQRLGQDTGAVRAVGAAGAAGAAGGVMGNGAGAMVAGEGGEASGACFRDDPLMRLPLGPPHVLNADWLPLPAVRAVAGLLKVMLSRPGGKLLEAEGALKEEREMLRVSRPSHLRLPVSSSCCKFPVLSFLSFVPKLFLPCTCSHARSHPPVILTILEIFTLSDELHRIGVLPGSTESTLEPWSVAWAGTLLLLLYAVVHSGALECGVGRHALALASLRLGSPSSAGADIYRIPPLATAQAVLVALTSTEYPLSQWVSCACRHMCVGGGRVMVECGVGRHAPPLAALRLGGPSDYILLPPPTISTIAPSAAFLSTSPATAKTAHNHSFYLSPTHPHASRVHPPPPTISTIAPSAAWPSACSPHNHSFSPLPILYLSHPHNPSGSVLLPHHLHHRPIHCLALCLQPLPFPLPSRLLPHPTPFPPCTPFQAGSSSFHHLHHRPIRCLALCLSAIVHLTIDDPSHGHISQASLLRLQWTCHRLWSKKKHRAPKRGSRSSKKHTTPLESTLLSLAIIGAASYYSCPSAFLQAVDILSALEQEEAQHAQTRQQQQQQAGALPSPSAASPSAAGVATGEERKREQCAQLLATALLALRQGNLVDARSRLAQGLLVTHRQLSNHQIAAHFLLAIGGIALRTSDLVGAKDILRSGLTLFRAARDTQGVVAVAAELSLLYRSTDEAMAESQNAAYLNRKRGELSQQVTAVVGAPGHAILLQVKIMFYAIFCPFAPSFFRPVAHAISSRLPYPRDCRRTSVARPAAFSSPIPSSIPSPIPSPISSPIPSPIPSSIPSPFPSPIPSPLPPPFLSPLAYPLPRRPFSPLSPFLSPVALSLSRRPFSVTSPFLSPVALALSRRPFSVTSPFLFPVALPPVALKLSRRRSSLPSPFLSPVAYPLSRRPLSLPSPILSPSKQSSPFLSPLPSPTSAPWRSPRNACPSPFVSPLPSPILAPSRSPRNACKSPFLSPLPSPHTLPFHNFRSISSLRALSFPSRSSFFYS
ncbi:unnamed protein product [Closterium sp. NIES-65]|nr:unnamed protein product [Closterium sp. NIES-65]